MGHRALVAVETRPGRYACYRSQWGGQVLLEQSRSPERAVAAAADGSRPVAVGSALAVLEALDPRDHEALFVAGLDGRVERYLVAWLGLVLATDAVSVEGADAAATDAAVRGTGAPAPDADGATALVPVADPATARRLATWLRVAKDVLGDAVDAGAVSPEAALLTARELLARHPDVPPETLWLHGG